MQTERKNNSKLHKNRTYLPGTICKSANELINHNQTAKCKLSIGAKNWKLIGLTRRIMPSVEDDDNLVRWFHSPASGFVLNVFFICLYAWKPTTEQCYSNTLPGISANSKILANSRWSINDRCFRMHLMKSF